MDELPKLIPSAFQFPELIQSSIVIRDQSVETEQFIETSEKLVAPINCSGRITGKITIGYLSKEKESDPIFFIPEEKDVLEMIVQKIGLIVDRILFKEEKEKLERQLRHADRLATIGTLSAGVAHELNEPLANILGFAQLNQKYLMKLLSETQENDEIRIALSDLNQFNDDTGRIIKSSLYARDIVKKLLIFSHQMPTKKKMVNPNVAIEDALFFLESRCAKQNIRIKKKFAYNLPEIYVDPSQINQVIINLVVNSIHAMPDGGEVIISTYVDKNKVTIEVKDNGTGMTEEIKKQIFLPFFTTKDIGEGTGLGLAVVHGIVKAHNAEIKVKSEPEKGTVFYVKFPFRISR